MYPHKEQRVNKNYVSNHNVSTIVKTLHIKKTNKSEKLFTVYSKGMKPWLPTYVTHTDTPMVLHVCTPNVAVTPW